MASSPRRGAAASQGPPGPASRWVEEVLSRSRRRPPGPPQRILESKWYCHDPAILAYLVDHAALEERTITTSAGLKIHLYRGELCIAQCRLAEELGLGRQVIRSALARLAAKGILRLYRPGHLYACPAIVKLNLRAVRLEYDRPGKSNQQGSVGFKGLSKPIWLTRLLPPRGASSAEITLGNTSQHKTACQGVRSGYGSAALRLFLEGHQAATWRGCILAALKKFSKAGLDVREVAAIVAFAGQVAPPQRQGQTAAWYIKRRLADAALVGADDLVNLREYLGRQSQSYNSHKKDEAERSEVIEGPETQAFSQEEPPEREYKKPSVDNVSGVTMEYDRVLRREVMTEIQSKRVDFSRHYTQGSREDETANGVLFCPTKAQVEKIFHFFVGAGKAGLVSPERLLRCAQCQCDPRASPVLSNCELYRQKNCPVSTQAEEGKRK
ncbi:hypothetical protein ES707_13402 [subsurface metagenome]